jgi:prepilin-type N-terminal cleavage/methylation domain-containing protein
MIFKKLVFKEEKIKFHQGFGLIELMVSVGIMVLVTSIVMSRQDSFNGATLLRGQAYDLALTVREIQLLAVSASNRVDSANFRNVYGLYFNTAIDDRAYRIFRDNTGGNAYFYDNGEAFGQQGVLDKRFAIDKIRLVGTGAPVTVTELAISFERPNFDARLYTASGVPVSSTVSAVEIDIIVRGSSGVGAGGVRTVEITRTGQISVKDI